MVSFNLPWEVIGMIGFSFLVLLTCTIIFGLYYFDMKGKNPELVTFNNARKPPFPPTVALVDLSSRMFFFNAVKDKPEDVKLKQDNYGLLIDPRFASKMPKSSLEDGAKVLFYGVNFHFPLDPNGARAIVQLIKKIRKEYPKVNFIRDDVVLMELLTKTGADLAEDVKVVMNMYPLEKHDDTTPQIKKSVFGFLMHEKKTEANEEEYVTDEELVSIIEDIKSKLKTWKVESGYFSMKDALDLLPIGTSSADMKRVEIVTKTNMQNEMGKQLEWWKQLTPFFFYAMAAIIIAWMIITAMSPKGGGGT